MADDELPTRAIVLDTAALIAGTETLYALGGLTDPKSNAPLEPPSPTRPVRFYVTPDVALETRDLTARNRLSALDRLGVIEQRVPSAEAVATVANFAKKTGDYAVLSPTDLRVLALCYMLEVERTGGRFLKTVPEGKVGEIRRVRGIAFDEVERIERERELREKEERERVGEGDGWCTVQKVERGAKKGKKKRVKKKKKSVGEEKVEVQSGAQVGGGHVGETGSVEAGDGDICEATREMGIAEDIRVVDKDESVAEHMLIPAERFGSTEDSLSRNKASTQQDEVPPGEELADGDDGIGWINEENLEEHLARDGGEEEMSEEDHLRVACVTTDFALQNTMLQMGIKLLSVDGRRTIRQIRRFAMRCHSCGAVTRELQRKFCEKCGNATMHRVAFKVDKKGVARVFLNPKKKAILRGSKYPIPLPRGGRHNKDLILCEDQIDPVKQRRLEKQRERLNVDVLDPSNFYNAGARFNPHDRPMVVGYGKRNPNEVRGGSKGKR